ncbi:unnamed protein product [Choristocarpus tenellus]
MQTQSLRLPSPVHCGPVLADVIHRMVSLRKKFAKAKIMISKMDVMDAFHQVPVDPKGAARFGHTVDKFVIDFRVQFRSRSSPG